MADSDDKAEKQQKGAKPTLTPEQEAEAAAKKAARAEAKAKGQKGRPAAGAKAAVATERVKRTGPPRLRKLYDAEVRAKLISEFALKNPMEAPRLQKITINMGLGEAVTNPKVLDTAVEELGAITGQKPVVTRAKKSIAVFKLRAGQKIGAMVTLRRDQMYEFLDRLVSFALPRVRDFKGVSPKSFDGRGNYTLGVREEIIFPEINYERIEKAKGMNITFSTTARTDEQGRALLRHLGMPFRT
ncbi:MAG: large subunit ribosomal protein [Myxococcales bacterium]|jgi:large subunit ribosomal protein L5|nr:large subunit ribosomal protein [Myxococcales bacterium]